MKEFAPYSPFENRPELQKKIGVQGARHQTGSHTIVISLETWQNMNYIQLKSTDLISHPEFAHVLLLV